MCAIDFRALVSVGLQRTPFRLQWSTLITPVRCQDDALSCVGAHKPSMVWRPVRYHQARLNVETVALLISPGKESSLALTKHQIQETVLQCRFETILDVIAIVTHEPWPWGGSTSKALSFRLWEDQPSSQRWVGFLIAPFMASFVADVM